MSNHPHRLLTKYPEYRHVYVWNDRSLCMGPSWSILPRHYGSMAIHVGIYDSFELNLGDGRRRLCRCAIVPPNTKHELYFSGGIQGKLFIERDSVDFVYAAKKFGYQPGQISCFESQEIIDYFQWAYETGPDINLVHTSLNDLLNVDGVVNTTVDPRIKTLIDLISSEPDRNYSQEDIAAAVDLSVSRVLHLFKDHLEVPYRRYRMWKRLRKAMRCLNQADNMTRAAHDSGFSDATHFSHCFRNTYGVNPSLVFRNVDRFQVSV